MSIRAMTWALDAKIGDSSAKLVLVALADHADDQNNKCWPSLGYLAGRCELSEDTIRRRLRRLERAGLLHIEHRIGAASRITLLIVDTPRSLRGVAAAATPTPSNRRQTEPSIEQPSLKNTLYARAREAEATAPIENYAQALPTTWQPNSGHLLLADQLGLSQRQVETSAAEMQSWAWGNGRNRANWDEFFKSWLRREAKRGKNGQYRKTLTERGRELIAESEELDRANGGAEICDVPLWPVPKLVKGR